MLILVSWLLQYTAVSDVIAEFLSLTDERIAESASSASDASIRGRSTQLTTHKWNHINNKIALNVYNTGIWYRILNWDSLLSKYTSFINRSIYHDQPKIMHQRLYLWQIYELLKSWCCAYASQKEIWCSNMDDCNIGLKCFAPNAFIQAFLSPTLIGIKARSVRHISKQKTTRNVSWTLQLYIQCGSNPLIARHQQTKKTPRFDSWMLQLYIDRIESIYC